MCIRDGAADGVIHAGLRFAPLLHTFGGLTPAAVLAAVEAGLDDGAAAKNDPRFHAPDDQEKPIRGLRCRYPSGIGRGAAHAEEPGDTPSTASFSIVFKYCSSKRFCCWSGRFDV